MQYNQVTIGQKIKLAIGAVAVAGALTFGGLKLYNLGEPKPTCREPSTLIIDVNNDPHSSTSFLSATDKLLEHEVASGYGQIKRRIVIEGKVATENTIDQHGVQSTDVSALPATQNNVVVYKIEPLGC